MNLKRAAAAAMLALPLAAAAACESVNVVVEPFVVQHDYTKTYRQINALAGDAGVLGMLRMSIEYSVQGCDVVVGYRGATLYVASELTRNRCAFEHVLEHEQGHVAIYERHIATLAARIKARKSAPDLFEAVQAEALSPEAENRAHDSPEEYARNKTACFGKIGPLVGLR